MYTKYFSSKRADVKSVLKRKPLVRAIALALMAGTVAVPASAWAATVTGVKFIDANRNGERDNIDGTLESLYTGGGSIYLKLTTAPATERPSTAQTDFSTGEYLFTNVAPGTYKVWQYVNPTSPIYTLMMSNDPGNPQYFASSATAKIISVANTTDVITHQDFPVPSLTQDAITYINAAQTRADTICSATGSNVVTVSSGTLTSPTTLPSGLDNSILSISQNAVVEVPNSQQPLHIQAVCNKGTLLGAQNGAVTIEYDDLFANFGEGKIEGSSVDLKRYYDVATESTKGCDEYSDYAKISGNCGYFGLFYNAGNIQGRNGLDRAHADTKTISPANLASYVGGNGGAVSVEGQSVVQNGTIQGGNGGNVNFNESYYLTWSTNQDLKVGGDGGAVTVAADFNGTLTGGASSVTESGQGGDVSVTNSCVDTYDPSNCSHYALEGGWSGELAVAGGETIPRGTYRGNSIYIDPTVSFMGSDTTLIADKDVVIFGGDNWLLELKNLKPEGITAGNKIILATGPGGTIDLRGNNAKIFKAGVQVEIYTDNLLLDAGVAIENLVDAPNGVVRGNAKIIYHAVITGSSQLTGKAGDTLPVSLALRNAGPKQDTYTLAVTSQNGWTVSGLPATVTVDGLKRADLNLNVTLPTEGNDVITVTATSQADSTVVATTQVQAAVEKPVVVEPEKVALTLTKSGEGTLTAQGIDCGTDCSEDYAINTNVVLTATPATGYQFTNWTGDCTSNTVTMDQAKTCVANFTMLRYTASGKLFAEPNMPLPGATVKIGDKTTTTDAHGNWQIDGLTNGNYTATVTKNGYTIPTQKVVVNGENLTFDLGVVYSAYGIIKDEQKQPVAGVTITIGDQHTQTDAVGYWKLDGLPAGESTLIASKDGYKFAPAKFVLGDQEPNKELVVTPASTLVMTAKPSPWQAIRQGANVTYTYTLFNGGVSTATGVTFTETVPNGAKLVSLTAKDGGDCDAQTLTCTLPDLTAGATAQVELVLQATDGNSLKNTATASANEYPTDVQTSYKTVKPHLSVTVTDSPDPVVMLTDLHYTATVELSPLAPEDTAKDINLVMQLPKGLELKAVTAAAGTCDSSQFPLISCQLPNLSIASPVPLLDKEGLGVVSDKEGLGVVSQTAVNVDVTLKDAGLLVLSNEAKVTASNYPAHTVREKTNIFIPDTIKIDMVLVIDTTNSMQAEINGVYAALNLLIKEVPAGQRPTMALIEFKDDVRVKAFTQDTDLMLGAVAKLVAEGGGTCPEASAEALEVALKHLKDGGTILLATDASPYPEANLENLAALIKSQNMKFNALITGDCTGEGDANEQLK